MSSKKKAVADFFLEESHPYSKKRGIKLLHVGTFFLLIVILVVGAGAIIDSRSAHEADEKKAKLEVERQAKATSDTTRADSQDQGFIKSPFSFLPRLSGQAQTRQHSASQLIKRGDAVSDQLPIGTMVKVRLIGKVESADGNSPVRAVVVEDAKSPADFSVIPTGTTVIGQGQLDSTRERLLVRFTTLVFPEGEQFSISAQAAMPDGSSGLIGDFSSGEFKRHASQFVGNFVGGMADGLKDRTTAGQFGLPFEPGSLKNGALNGIAASSLDYAKSSSDNMGQGGASISVKTGQDFVLYFEKEFHQ